MKNFIVFSLCFFSTNVFAWNIVKEKDDLFLSDQLLKEKIKVFALNEKTPVEVIKLEKNIIILRYLESKSGTKDMTETFNCSVFNSATKKMIGIDQLCRTITTFVGGKTAESNAIFKVEQDNVSYSFEELAEKFPLK